MTNLETIQKLYRTFREKDYEAFKNLCTPDIEWIQSEGFPNGQTYKGADAVIEGVFKANRERWANFSFKIEQYLDAGQTIIVIGAYTGLSKSSQKPLQAAVAHVYDLVDGKVTRLVNVCRHKNNLEFFRVIR